MLRWNFSPALSKLKQLADKSGNDPKTKTFDPSLKMQRPCLCVWVYAEVLEKKVWK